MADDIAVLGLQVDSAPVAKGAAELDKLSDSAKRAVPGRAGSGDNVVPRPKPERNLP